MKMPRVSGGQFGSFGATKGRHLLYSNQGFELISKHYYLEDVGFAFIARRSVLCRAEKKSANVFSSDVTSSEGLDPQNSLHRTDCNR